jgi:RNA polymerase sigma-70 factor (ECF subfamily)
VSQALPDSTALSGVLAAGSSDGRVDANPSGRSDARATRVKSIIAEHYSFLWRSLRRLGVPEANVEDAAQKCLWVIATRVDDIASGKEKTFLFGVALRVARAERRQCQALRSVNDDLLLAKLPAAGPDPGEQLDERRARIVLDALLESLPLDLRTVFVLYEIEELTMAEIAAALDVPSGTVASRLRRAREAFEVMSLRVQKQVRRKERFR